MLKINLIEANNYEQRREKLDRVLSLIQRVLNQDDFKNMILDFTTDGKRTFYYRKNIFGRYKDQPHTNQEVYDIIMKGVEEPGDQEPDSMDLYLTLLNGSNGSTIGYGNHGTKEIFTYSVMFDKMIEPELANHYVHEWCHKLGFEHSYERNRRRNYSVPYAVGNIVEELAEKLMEERQELVSTDVTISVTFKGATNGELTIEIEDQAPKIVKGKGSYSFFNVSAGKQLSLKYEGAGNVDIKSSRNTSGGIFWNLIGGGSTTSYFF